MKKLIFLSLLLVFAAACQKNSVTPPGNSLSATIDGKDVVFKDIGVDSSSSSLGISGAGDTTATAPFFSIYIYHTAPLTVGSYPFLAPGGALSELDYYERPGGVLTEYQSPDDVVTITAISNLAITGTFQGTCDLSYIDPNTFQVIFDPTHVRMVTSGKFNIRLH
jgi:hypothetical protein